MEWLQRTFSPADSTCGTRRAGLARRGGRDCAADLGEARTFPKLPEPGQTTNNRLAALPGGVSRTYTHDANQRQPHRRRGDELRLGGARAAGECDQRRRDDELPGQRAGPAGEEVERGRHALLLLRPRRPPAGRGGQAGAIVREHVWLEDTPVAVLNGPGSGTTVRWVFADHLECTYA